MRVLSYAVQKMIAVSALVIFLLGSLFPLLSAAVGDGVVARYPLARFIYLPAPTYYDGEMLLRDLAAFAFYLILALVIGWCARAFDLAAGRRSGHGAAFVLIDVLSAVVGVTAAGLLLARWIGFVQNQGAHLALDGDQVVLASIFLGAPVIVGLSLFFIIGRERRLESGTIAKSP